MVTASQRSKRAAKQTTENIDFPPVLNHNNLNLKRQMHAAALDIALKRLGARGVNTRQRYSPTGAFSLGEPKPALDDGAQMHDHLKAAHAINTTCPWSGKPISEDSLTAYRGHVVGFCNPGCRDKFQTAVELFETAMPTDQKSNS